MVRRAFTRSMLVLALLGTSGAVLIFATGGFDASLFGTLVTARNPLRPLMLGSLALTLYILAGGEVRVPRNAVERLTHSRLNRVPWPVTLASALAITMAVTTWVYGAKAVGGADTYGYMSQSELWADGLPKLVRPIIAEVPWSNAAWTFSPIGAYRPMSSFRDVEGADRWTLVPVYPPGLPLLLAAAGAVGGFQAKFMVVPFMAGLLVLATYGIGARLLAPSAGLAAAWLVATSPPVLFIAAVVMSDVPAAALWASALFLTLGRGPIAALGAGAVGGFAILVRPNLAPLAAILALRHVPGLLSRATRLTAARDLLLFGAAAAIPVAGLALLHTVLYGSPTASGYGVTSGFFTADHVEPNVRRYFSWFLQSHTPVALAGLAAIFVPSRRLWPRVDLRIAGLIAPLFVLFIWTIYIAYIVFDDWWYLRFLLPSYPLIMIGLAALAAALVRWRPREMRSLVGTAVIVLGAVQLGRAYTYGIQDHWMGERRYVMAAQMAREYTPRNSLIIANQHMASISYYASRTAIRFDSLPSRWLDRSIRWLERRDVEVFLLLEDWELEAFMERFADQRALDVFRRQPLAIYREPGLLYLFDLSSTEPSGEPVNVWSGVYRDLLAVRPGPEPQPLGFEP
jgi:hypothetical protein